MGVYKGLKAALILTGFIALIGYLAGSLTNEALPFAGLFSFWAWSLPAIAGIFAGWHSPSRPWRDGALSAFILWALKIICLLWFLPRLLAAEAIILSLAYSLPAGALGGIFGLNLRLAKAKGDTPQ